MNLDEFVEQEHERIDNFKAHWLYEHSHNSDDYPLELDEGMWDEQLNTYDPKD